MVRLTDCLDMIIVMTGTLNPDQTNKQYIDFLLSILDIKTTMIPNYSTLDKLSTNWVFSPLVCNSIGYFLLQLGNQN